MNDSLTPIGYSGTPLLKKLGFKPNQTLLLVDAPAEYFTWLGGLPSGTKLLDETANVVEAAHLFVTERVLLAMQLTILRKRLTQDGFVWVSWPKKSSKVATDVDEDAIREICLPMGYVDIKVCAVSEIWSGLKLVIRRTERTARPHANG
jgi:hypothetical protein